MRVLVTTTINGILKFWPGLLASFVGLDTCSRYIAIYLCRLDSVIDRQYRGVFLRRGRAKKTPHRDGMLSVLAREHSAKLMNRLSSNVLRRSAQPSQSTLIRTAFFSNLSPAKKAEKPKHVKRIRVYPPGINPPPVRIKIHGSSLKVKVFDPIKEEAKIVKAETDALFKVETKAREKASAYLDEKLANIDIPRLANFMRCSAQTLKKEPETFIKLHLPAIALRISELSTKEWSYREIAFVIYGLQFDKNKDRHSLGILANMVKVTTETLKREIPPKSLDIAMIILGMQHNRSSQVQANNMMGLVNEMLAACCNQFDAQSLSNSFYGLKGMDSNSPQSLAVLVSLIPRIAKCKQPLSPQQVSYALCGLQSMSNSSPEVIAALNALGPKVSIISKSFRASHIGNAVLGFAGMTSDSPEVIAVLDRLVPEFQLCREDLNADDIAKVLKGTKKLGNKCLQVRSLKTAVGMRKYLDVEDRKVTTDENLV